MITIKDPAIDYQSKTVLHSDTIYSRVFPLSSQNISILNAPVQSQIEFPSAGFNISTSFLQFQVGVLEPTGGTGNYNYINTLGMTMFDQVNIQSREGVFIAQINNANIVTRSLLPYLVKLEDMLTFDTTLGTNSTIQQCVSFDDGFNLFASNTIANKNTVTALGPTSSRIGSSTYCTSSTSSNTVTPIGETPSKSYTELQYYKVGLSADGKGTGDVFQSHMVPMKYLMPHTLGSLDRVVNLGQNSILNLYWAGINAFGWESTSDGTTGNIGLNAKALTGAITIYNLNLILAKESNPVVSEELVALGHAGISFPIPFLTVYPYSPGQAQSITQTQKLNQSIGRNWLCSYQFVLSNNTQTGLTLYDMSNNNPLADFTPGFASKIQTTQLQVNSQNATQFTLNDTANDLYNQMRETIQGSCIQNSNMFNYNRMYIQSYRKGRSVDYLKHDYLEDGRSLLTEQTLAITYTTANVALRSFIVVVTQRMLNIRPGGLISLS